MISFIKLLFEKHISSKSRERLLLFEHFAFYSDLIFKVGLVMYGGSSFMFFISPIYAYIFENRLEPLILLYVPGLDEKTMTGYFVLISIQFFVMVMASVGMGSCDVFYALILSNIPIMARLIEDEVHTLNKALEQHPYKNRVWFFQFRNIVMMHQEMSM